MSRKHKKQDESKLKALFAVSITIIIIIYFLSS